MTLGEMRARMSAEEYHGWVRYYNTEPFGFTRREAMHGDVMSSLWALHGGPKSPEKLRSAHHWQYSPTLNEDIDDPEAEAALILSKLRK